MASDDAKFERARRSTARWAGFIGAGRNLDDEIDAARAANEQRAHEPDGRTTAEILADWGDADAERRSPR